MIKELCGMPTENGPCNMRKGHSTPYHRYRVYSTVTWTIETPGGVTIESGQGRMGLQNATTKALRDHGTVVIHVKHWDDKSDLNEDGS